MAPHAGDDATAADIGRWGGGGRVCSLPQTNIAIIDIGVVMNIVHEFQEARNSLRRTVSMSRGWDDVDGGEDGGM